MHVQHHIVHKGMVNGQAGNIEGILREYVSIQRRAKSCKVTNTSFYIYAIILKWTNCKEYLIELRF